MINLQQLNENFSFTNAAKARIESFAVDAKTRKLIPEVVSIMETKLNPNDGSSSKYFIAIGFFSKGQVDKFPKGTVANIDGIRVAFGLASDRYQYFFARTLDVDSDGIFFLT
jgi:hypothetical protein